jgi:hypothetical protein
MPFYFELDRQHAILRVVAEGRVDDEALASLYRGVGEHYTRVAARAAILDFSAVTSFEVSLELIQLLAKSPTALPEPGTPRFIVAPQTHVFGAMRMFQLIGEPKRPRLLVVRTPEEAYAELGVESPRFERIGEAGG